MKFATLSPYFKFSKSQRTGLFALFGIIVIIQCCYFFIDFESAIKVTDKNKRWVVLPMVKDSVGFKGKTAYVMHPFNPNFITDFKGYKLGMSVEEIDRLLAYRKSNRYVNSPQEFQQVTQVSDSLLKTIEPYFKFPDWVMKRHQLKTYSKTTFVRAAAKAPLDINEASQEDLKKVYGIGDGLSVRILKEKEKLGGFVSMKQMDDVWGLSPEVIASLNKDFKVGNISMIRKFNVNQLNVKELMQFPYFKYPIAKAIVTFRSMNNGIKNTEDLSKISGFPMDKIEIIALYLEF